MTRWTIHMHVRVQNTQAPDRTPRWLVTGMVEASVASVTSQSTSSPLKSGLNKRCKGWTFMKRWETYDGEDALVYFPFLLSRIILCQGHVENPFNNSINSNKRQKVKSNRAAMEWRRLCWGFEEFLQVLLDLWPSDKEGIKSQQGWIYTECK